jgi:hypothetical protein
MDLHPFMPTWVPKESQLVITSYAEVEWINTEEERRAGRSPLRVVTRSTEVDG